MIVIGSGVLNQQHMVENVYHIFELLVSGYVEYSLIENYIVTPGLDGEAELVGCFLLAKQLIDKK